MITDVPFHKSVASRSVSMLALAMFLLLATGCHSGKHTKKTEHEPQATVKVEKLRGVEKKIVEEAMTWMGTPYKYAGSDKGVGTDCSGMVLRVYEDAAGLKLPRNSRKQAEFCKKLKKGDVKAGDLVFFATGKDAGVVSHVGIMIDGSRFVHASSKKGVIISDLTTPYYQRTFLMYGRVPGAVADN